MADPILIATWRKNVREHVRVLLDSYNGHNVITARVFVEGDDGEPRPTKQGLTISTKHLPQLADALVKARAEAERRGLLQHEEAA